MPIYIYVAIYLDVCDVYLYLYIHTVHTHISTSN